MAALLRYVPPPAARNGVQGWRGSVCRCDCGQSPLACVSTCFFCCDSEPRPVVRIRVRGIVVRIRVADAAIRIRVVVGTLDHTGPAQTSARFASPRCRGKAFPAFNRQKSSARGALAAYQPPAPTLSRGLRYLDCAREGEPRPAARIRVRGIEERIREADAAKRIRVVAGTQDHTGR